MKICGAQAQLIQQHNFYLCGSGITVIVEEEEERLQVCCEIGSPRNVREEPGVVTHAFNPSIWEVEDF